MHTRLFVVVLTLLCLGVISLLKLPLNLLPGIEQPSLLVRTEWPGASAQEVERAISEPMEALLGTVPGLASVHSFSRQEISLIELSLQPDAERDMAFIRVREKLEVLRDQLPASVKDPTVIRSNAADKPIAVFAVSSKNSQKSLQSELELKNWADQVFARRLEAIDGVAHAVIIGATQAEIAIRFKPEVLDRFDIRIEELSYLISNQNTFTSSGLLRDSWYRYALKAETRIRNEEDILQIPVKRLESGRVIRISDIAEIRTEAAPAQSFALLQSRNLILVQVKKEFGKNTVQVTESLYPIIEQLKIAFPEVQIQLLDEQASLIKSTIRDLLFALISGGILSFIVLFVFLKDPYLPFSIGLSIPLSLLISFFVMYLLGIDLNIISLGGLTLGIGLLVDNSIVVLENMKRHKELGKTLAQAAKDATQEIALAVTASTFTTVSVFIPLLYLGGVQGVLFRDQALTLSISLIASLLVALFFLPPAAIAMSGKRAHSGHLFDQSQWLHNVIEGYETLLKKALRVPWWSFAGMLALLAFLVLLMVVIPKQILPSQKETTYSARVFLPANTAIESTEISARLLSNALLAQDSSLTIQIYGGFSDQTNLSLLADEALNRFKISIQVQDYSQMEPVKKLFAAFIADKWGWSYEEIRDEELFGSVLALSPDVALISIENRTREGTDEIARALEERLQQIRPGTRLEKKYPQTQKIIALSEDNEARRLYDIPLQNILSQLQTLDLGLEATSIQRGAEQISVRLKRQQTYADLSQAPIFWEGNRFRLEQLMHIEEIVSPEMFERDKQQAVETWVLNWNLSDWFSHKEELLNITSHQDFSRFTMFVKGLGTEISVLINDLSELLLLSIILIYLILAAQFENWVYPLFMVISIPMSWLGAFLMLTFMGLELSMFAGLGLLILSGVAVNDAILKIDFMSRHLKENGNVMEAILEAGYARFRPVVMTSVTTILGLLPMVMPFGTNYEMSQALAASLIGGMISSTTLTFFVMPILFYLKEFRVKNFLQAKKASFRKQNEEIKK